jgi:hypothetical protein
MTASNAVRVGIVQRSSFATPATRDLLVFPVTAQSLRNRVGYQQSNTLRTDANIQDLVRLTQSVSGGLPAELTFPVVNEALWFLMRGAMRATETAVATVASCSTTGAAKTITRASGSFISDGIEVGDIVRTTGATPAGDNGLWKVTAVLALTLTVEAAANFTGSAGNVTVTRGARMKNGTSQNYFDVEVARTDGSLFELFEKVVVNGMSINIADGGITTCSFDLLGASSQRNTSTYAVSTANPTTMPILDALGVPVFNLGGSAYSAKSIGFSMTHSIRAQTQVGTLGATGFSWGATQVTTSSSSYLSNWTEMSNYTGNVATDLWFAMQDSGGRVLTVSMPQHKWSDLGADTRGLNQDDYLDGSGQAVLDPVEGCTLRIQRFV